MTSADPANPGGKPPWQADATQLDIEIYDPSDGQVKRPWIFALVDENRQSILRRDVLFLEPCVKDYEQPIQSPVEESEAPVGPPELPNAIVTDNQSLFSSSEFCEAVSKLGVRITRTPRSAPNDTGALERLFKKIQNEVQKWAEGNTRLSFDEFTTKVDKLITDYNSGLGGDASRTGA